MKYRIRCDLIIDPANTATRDQVLAALNKVKSKLQRITEFETSHIDVEECRHDEGKPCTRISLWEKE